MVWNRQIGLKLPQDIESYNELLQARAFYSTVPIQPIKAAYSHPSILMRSHCRGDSIEVVMKTTKGNITLLLFTDKAPGSVANFLELCQKDFYDNKFSTV